MEQNNGLIQEIKCLLLNEWDPIGISGIPEANDEYDCYVYTIFKMIKEKREESDFYDYLYWVESEQIGLDVNIIHTQTIAKKLKQFI